MAESFHRSVRQMGADRGIMERVALVTTILLSIAWVCWLLCGRVGVFVVSSAARVEVDQASHPVESPIEGRVSRTALSLNALVGEGDVLVELDFEAERLELTRLLAYVEAIDPQLLAIQAELSLRELARDNEGRVGRALGGEASARIEQADAAAALAEDQRRRAHRLYESGAIHESEFRRIEAEALQTRAAADGARHVPHRLLWEQRTSDSDRRALIEQLKRSAAHFEGEKKTALAKVALLEHQIAQRRVVAPISGRLGEISPLRTGQYVKAGDWLATVVPHGDLKIVAEFDPSMALGRVQQGSRARLRLTGFPWTQFGMLPAEVSGVGSEVRNGSVRVELRLLPSSTRAIPLQHGLPGTAEIEVERISPATLLLRLAGKIMENDSGSTTEDRLREPLIRSEETP